MQIKEVYSSAVMLHRQSWQLEFTLKREWKVNADSSRSFPLSFICFYSSFRACSLKSSMKRPSRLKFSVEWEVLVTINIRFASSFTPPCLQIFSDALFNSGAFYFRLCNALSIAVPRWHCYMGISHLLFVCSPVIWAVWLSDWFKKVSV